MLERSDAGSTEEHRERRLPQDGDVNELARRQDTDVLAAESACGEAAAGACTVSGSTVTLTTTGVRTITASQPGNGTFNAAPNVSQSFTVPV